jgi:hypothetical protein
MFDSKIQYFFATSEKKILFLKHVFWTAYKIHTKSLTPILNMICKKFCQINYFCRSWAGNFVIPSYTNSSTIFHHDVLRSISAHTRRIWQLQWRNWSVPQSSRTKTDYWPHPRRLMSCYSYFDYFSQLQYSRLIIFPIRIYLSRLCVGNKNWWQNLICK